MAVKVKKNVQVDASNLMAHLHDFSQVLGKNLGETVREQAGLFCMDLIKYSGPYKGAGKGLDSSAKKKGEDNLKKSVFKIFQPVERATAEQVASIGSFDVFKLWIKSPGHKSVGKKGLEKQWEAFKSKHPSTRATTFISSGDFAAMTTLHNRHRKYQGKGGLMPYAIRAKSGFAIVPKEKDIERYYSLKKDNVGIMKSGYWFASQKIRAKEVKAPAWVKHSQGSSLAIGVDQINQPMKPEVTIGNMIGKRVIPNAQFRAALNYRMYAMRVRMAAELNKKKIALWRSSLSGSTTNTSKFF